MDEEKSPALVVLTAILVIVLAVLVVVLGLIAAGSASSDEPDQKRLEAVYCGGVVDGLVEAALAGGVLPEAPPQRDLQAAHSQCIRSQQWLNSRVLG